jgi:hypothetical protein
MKQLLKALRGARVIARGVDNNGREVIHYLCADQRTVIEIVR